MNDDSAGDPRTLRVFEGINKNGPLQLEYPLITTINTKANKTFELQSP